MDKSRTQEDVGELLYQALRQLSPAQGRKVQAIYREVGRQRSSPIRQGIHRERRTEEANMTPQRQETVPDGDIKHFEVKRVVDLLLAKMTVGQFLKLYRILGLPNGPERVRTLMAEACAMKEEG